MRGRRRWLIVLGLLAAGGAGFLAYAGCSKRKSTDELINDLKSGNEKDRIIAVRTLPPGADEADKVVPALIAALRDGESDVRRSAAIRLGLFGDLARDAIPELEKRLNDGDARVREAAGRALTRIDPEKYPTPPKAGSAPKTPPDRLAK